MTREKTQRCASCYTARGRIHSLYCRIEDRTLFPDGPVYNDTIGYSYSSSSCDTSTSDNGSSCGRAG